MRVLVVGAGRMGAQIGCEYALGGHDVSFAARDVGAALRRVEEAFALAARAGLAEAADVEHARRSVTVSREPSLACELVVESVPEDLQLKVNVLRPVVEESPAAVVATNTSSLSVTELGEALGTGESVVGTHYWNPPLLMPPVEVVAGAATDPAVVGRVCALLAGLGKRPVVVGDVPGFVWNRLQLAVVREALWLVEHGAASPATVDEIVREGLARRWRHVGPFAAAALGGVETWLRVGENLLPALSRAQSLDGLERWLERDEEALAAAAERRDAALVEELARDRSEDAHAG